MRRPYDRNCRLIARKGMRQHETSRKVSSCFHAHTSAGFNMKQLIKGPTLRCVEQEAKWNSPFMSHVPVAFLSSRCLKPGHKRKEKNRASDEPYLIVWLLPVII